MKRFSITSKISRAFLSSFSLREASNTLTIAGIICLKAFYTVPKKINKISKESLKKVQFQNKLCPLFISYDIILVFWVNEFCQLAKCANKTRKKIHSPYEHLLFFFFFYYPFSLSLSIQLCIIFLLNLQNGSSTNFLAFWINNSLGEKLEKVSSLIHQELGNYFKESIDTVDTNFTMANSSTWTSLVQEGQQFRPLIFSNINTSNRRNSASNGMTNKVTKRY